MEKKRKGILSWLLPAEGSDIFITGALLILAFLGIIMIGSASMGEATTQLELLVNIAKQAVFVVIGYFVMVYMTHHFRISQLKGNGFSMCIILLYVLLLACLAFTAVNGSKAWIRIPLGVAEVTIQPSEFAKVATFLIVAAHLGDVRFTDDQKLFDIIRKPVIICGSMAFIILVLQSDLGSMAVQFLIFCVCYLVPRSPRLKKSQRVLSILFYVTVIGVIVLLSPIGEELIDNLPIQDYQKNRFIAAINPFQDAYGSGYQLIASLVAFSEGGFFGKGFGNSTRKYMSFPEATNDFILAIYVEEWGWVGFIALIVIYSVIIFRLLSYAKKIQQDSARVILVGTAMYFLIHIFFNVGGVTGLIPLTGVPLPLMSAGGSSAVAFMMSVGISQSIISAYKRGIIK